MAEVTRRYAEDTKVPISRSHDTIRTELRKLKAEQVGIMEGADRHYVVFLVNDIRYIITTPPLPKAKDMEREHMRAWRSIVLLVKAKAVAISEGISTVEREFLANAVMPDGTTLADHSTRLIQQAYKEGGSPKTLLLGSS
jgi:hypothetical protein